MKTIELFSYKLSLLPPQSVFNAESIEVFPYPTSRKITIQWPEGAAQVQILNAQSTVLLQKKGQKPLDFDLSWLDSGVYFVKIERVGRAAVWRKVEVVR